MWDDDLAAVIMKVSVFWDITLSTDILEECVTSICFMLASCLAYCLTLKMEATSSSETSADV
jgi:hypothetical protein